MPLYFSIALLLTLAYLTMAWCLHRQVLRDRGPREYLSPGMEIHLSAYGQVMRYATTRDQSDGEKFHAFWSVEPFSSGPVACVHPRSAIGIHVHHGRLTLLVSGKKKILTPGDGISIPRNTPYRYFNGSRDQVEATLEASPACAMDMFLIQLDRSGVGHEASPGLRTCLQALVLSTTYDCMYPAVLPIRLQKVIAMLVAPVNRLLGIRNYYAD